MISGWEEPLDRASVSQDPMIGGIEFPSKHSLEARLVANKSRLLPNELIMVRPGVLSSFFSPLFISMTQKPHFIFLLNSGSSSTPRVFPPSSNFRQLIPSYFMYPYSLSASSTTLPPPI